jgi:hypothetical protein
MFPLNKLVLALFKLEQKYFISLLSVSSGAGLTIFFLLGFLGLLTFSISILFNRGYIIMLCDRILFSNI